MNVTWYVLQKINILWLSFLLRGVCILRDKPVIFSSENMNEHRFKERTVRRLIFLPWLTVTLVQTFCALFYAFCRARAEDSQGEVPTPLILRF